MLSILPEYLFLAPFSYLALRLIVAGVLGWSAWLHASGGKGWVRPFAIVEVFVLGFIMGGAWTQAAGIAGVFILFADLAVARLRVLPRSTVAIACILSACLVVTGAGPFAFDLPL